MVLIFFIRGVLSEKGNLALDGDFQLRTILELIHDSKPREMVFSSISH